MHTNRIQNHPSQKSKRGSALLSAVLFAFIVSLLMGSYLNLATSEYRIASRSYMMNGSFNIAEGGVEHAMNALNRKDDTGWTTNADGAGVTYWARSYTGYDIGNGLGGEIDVVIVGALTDTPTIYSQGVVTGSTVGGDLRRQVTVTLNQGSFFLSNAVDSKSGVDLVGNNVTIDSYNSCKGVYNELLPNGEYNKNSEATVATVAVTDSLNVGNAKIYGYVATGAYTPNVGPKGAITTYENEGVVDMSRVTTDYTADFPTITAPTVSAREMPTSGDIGSDDNAGVKSTEMYYMTGAWNLSGDLHIYDDVIFVTDGDINVTGNSAGVILHGNATLTIYSSADVKIAGKGILNGLDEDDNVYANPSNQNPENLKIFGTNPTAGGQDIMITGNGVFSGVVYAPNADVEAKGGGSSGMVKGAIVSNSVKFTGGTHFAYDECLADLDLGGPSYNVNDWVEMTSMGMNTTPIDLSAYGL